MITVEDILGIFDRNEHGTNDSVDLDYLTAATQIVELIKKDNNQIVPPT